MILTESLGLDICLQHDRKAIFLKKKIRSKLIWPYVTKGKFLSRITYRHSTSICFLTRDFRG